MGGRGSGSATSRTGQKQAAGFTIDTVMAKSPTQVINSGMAPLDAMRVASEQIKDLPYEMGVVIAPNGDLYVTKGDAASVRMDIWSATAKTGYKPSELITLHNHPTEAGRPIGGPASDSDFSAMIFRGMSTSYIAATEGMYKVSVRSVDTNTKADAFFSQRDRWGKRKTSNYMRNVDKAFSADLKYSGADGYLRAAYDTLKKFGPRYGFSIEFTPNSGWEHLYD